MTDEPRRPNFDEGSNVADLGAFRKAKENDRRAQELDEFLKKGGTEVRGTSAAEDGNIGIDRTSRTFAVSADIHYLDENVSSPARDLFEDFPGQSPAPEHPEQKHWDDAFLSALLHLGKNDVLDDPAVHKVHVRVKHYPSGESREFVHRLNRPNGGAVTPITGGTPPKNQGK